jgi:uncharacterized protein (TIGR01777 family)
MKILVSGASGFIGTHLVRALRQNGHTVGRLVRPGGHYFEPGDVSWAPMAASVDTAALDGTDAFVHLSGASIADGRWSPERKAILRSSRVGATRVLVDAIARLSRKPKVFLCGSAIGYYGDRGEEILTEASEPGTDFLAHLARDWEAEAVRAEHAGIRTLRLRFGVILSADGGALPRMVSPFKLGLGGTFASGRQWMSWIAIEDVIGAVEFLMMNEAISGPVNIVAPGPVRNAEFARALARVLHRPAVFRAPSLALRLALGEMAGPLLLSSQHVRSEKLMAAKFGFRFTDLTAALNSTLDRKAQA